MGVNIAASTWNSCISFSLDCSWAVNSSTTLASWFRVWGLGFRRSLGASCAPDDGDKEEKTKQNNCQPCVCVCVCV